LATGPSSGGTASTVRSQQGPWLATRDACLKSKTRVACVRDLSLARIAAIRTQSKSARSADAKGTSLGPFAFRCEPPDTLLSITYVNVKPGFAWIVRKNGASMLQQQRSGSGARYEGDGTLFWEAQGEARWRDQTNDPEVTCKRAEGPGQ
ncbi:MAG TPA: MliC family protein, partial [Casimicrobiaceae bacterium]